VLLLLLLLLLLLPLVLLLLVPLLPLLVPPLLLLMSLVLLAPPLLLALSGPWRPLPPLLLSLPLLLALPPARSVFLQVSVFARLLGLSARGPNRTRRFCILTPQSALATSRIFSSPVLAHQRRYFQVQATSLSAWWLSAPSPNNRTSVNSVTQAGPSPVGCDFGMQDIMVLPGSRSSPASLQKNSTSVKSHPTTCAARVLTCDNVILPSTHHSGKDLLKVQNTVGTRTCVPGLFSIIPTAIGICIIQLT
jgi:hypothetical protein